MDYWEDRLARNGKYDEYEKAILKLRASKKTARDQDICYNSLCNAGIYSEEAEEMINLEVNDE
jgi:hypothetical protein